MIERCGVVVDNTFYEIKNIASNPENEFIMDPIELYNILKKENANLQFIVHTHRDNCLPSHKDLNSMMIWRIPWIILSKNCVKGYYYSVFGVLEFDVITLLPKEVYHSLMKLLE